MLCLRIDPDRQVVIPQCRSQGDVIESRILREGAVRIDPPGLDFTLSELFAP